MRRPFYFVAAAALIASLGGYSRSFQNQTGGGRTAGASASGTAGAAAGTTAGAATPGTPGAAAPGTAGAATPGTAGAAGNVGVGQRVANFPGPIAPVPNVTVMNGVSPTPWFADPAVRRQIGLSNAQLNRLNQAYLAALQQFNQDVARVGTITPPNAPEQRTAALQQFQNRFNADFNATVNSTLTDSAMRSRFHQLGLQFRGLGAFSDPLIQQQLGLTPRQQQQLRRLAAEFRRDLTQLRRDARANPNVVQQQFDDLQTQFANRLNRVLSPSQQQLWTQLTGQPFQFPATVFVPPTTTAPAAVPPATTSPTAVQPTPGTTTVPQTGAVPTQPDSTVR